MPSRWILAGAILDDTLTGKPERRGTAEAAAAAKEEAAIAKERALVGDIAVVGPGSVDLARIFQEVGALPADLDGELQKQKQGKKQEEEEELEEGEIDDDGKEDKAEEYDPLRPQLDVAVPRSKERGKGEERIKTPPWRQPREEFIDDPFLKEKIFGHTDPTRRCRACVLVWEGRCKEHRRHECRACFQERQGKCDRHRPRRRCYTSKKLCEHRWLDLSWAVDDPANVGGTWWLEGVDDEGGRFELDGVCERCEKEVVPELVCEELARKMVRRIREGLKANARGKREEVQATKNVEPSMARAEREIGVLLLMLRRKQGWDRTRREKREKERERRDAKEMQEKVDLLFQNIDRLQASLPPLAALAEAEVMASVEGQVAEFVKHVRRMSEHEGQAMPPPCPPNTTASLAATESPEAQETVLEYRAFTHCVDPPTTTDSIMAIRGSPVPNLELEFPAPVEFGIGPDSPSTMAVQSELETSQEVEKILALPAPKEMYATPPSAAPSTPETSVDIQTKTWMTTSAQRTIEALPSPPQSSPPSPLPNSRKRSRTASLPVASLSTIKRARLSLPAILDSAAAITDPSRPPTRARSSSLSSSATRTASVSEPAPQTTRRKRSRTTSLSEGVVEGMDSGKRLRLASLPWGLVRRDSGVGGEREGAGEGVVGSGAGVHTPPSSSARECSVEIITERSVEEEDVEKAYVEGLGELKGAAVMADEVMELSKMEAVFEEAVVMRKRSYVEDEVDFSDGSLFGSDED